MLGFSLEKRHDVGDISLGIWKNSLNEPGGRCIGGEAGSKSGPKGGGPTGGE